MKAFTDHHTQNSNASQHSMLDKKKGDRSVSRKSHKETPSVCSKQNFRAKKKAFGSSIHKGCLDSAQEEEPEQEKMHLGNQVNMMLMRQSGKYDAQEMYAMRFGTCPAGLSLREGGVLGGEGGVRGGASIPLPCLRSSFSCGGVHVRTDCRGHLTELSRNMSLLERSNETSPEENLKMCSGLT